MTDDRPKIDYRKDAPAAAPRPLASYVSDPTVNPYAFEEYPMPIIYDRDDSNDYDPIADYRAEQDAEYDRVTRSMNSGVIPLRWYVIGMIAVMVVVIVLVAVANLVAR